MGTRVPRDPRRCTPWREPGLVPSRPGRWPGAGRRQHAVEQASCLALGHYFWVNSAHVALKEKIFINLDMLQ